MSIEAVKRVAVLPPGLFRLVLAFAVVVSHASRFDIGRLAVLLFFYLSGYWVSRVYLSEFDGRRWLSFYIGRWLRIAPLYFIVMFAAALFRVLPVSWENLTLIGVDTTHRDPTGVAWSLDIELQFYLLLPLAFAIRWPRGAILPALGVLTALGWWLHDRLGLGSALMYLPVFALGTLNAQTRWVPTSKTALMSLAAFGLLTAAIAAMPATEVFLDKTKPHPFDQDWFSMIWMLPLVPYIACSLAQKSSRFDRDVGNWSYPLYLVHYPLIALAATYGYSKWVGVAAALGVALSLFYGPDRFFERGRRWVINGGWKVSKPDPATPTPQTQAPIQGS